MKIVVNARFLHPKRMEGIGRYTYEIVRRLVAAHPEDSFILMTDNKYLFEFDFPENVKLIKKGLPARHPFLFFFWFEWTVSNILKKHRADVFYSPDGFIPLRRKVPKVPVVHDIAWKHFPKQVPWIHRIFYRTMMPRFLREAKKVITVSRFSKMDLMQNFHLPSSRIVVTGNAVDETFGPVDEITQVKIRRTYSNACDYFFYVGAIHPRKNIANLIRAFDLFKKETHSDMKLLLAGRKAWKTKEIDKAYKAAAHKEDVVFLGFVPPEDLPLLMGSAFALTYVSIFEGFGVPLLEAMACDVPVITSTTSSMPEVAGDAALLVNPFDPAEIARAMVRLRKDIGLYNRLMELGREQVKKFNWDVYAAQTYEVLRKAAGG